MANLEKKGWNDGEKPDGANDLKEVYAAGAVLYRTGEDAAVEVAVVHRPRYDDWSLPKGKLDKGETLPVTALREITEETGYHAVLGTYLGTTRYGIKDGVRKAVTYWAAAVSSGEFAANEEVDMLRWMPVDEATALVTYDLDEQVLHRFATAVVPHIAGLRTVLLVRHARAGDRTQWTGNDLLRPLDKKGRQQAEFLTPILRAFGAARIISAEPERCIRTVQPLADELGLDIEITEVVGDIACQQDPVAGAAYVQSLGALEQHTTAVVCSQGLAIPEILHSLAEGTLLADHDFATKKAALWVLSFSHGQLFAADYVASPLPEH